MTRPVPNFVMTKAERNELRKIRGIAVGQRTTEQIRRMMDLRRAELRERGH